MSTTTLRTPGPATRRPAAAHPGRAANRGVAVLVLLAATAHVWMMSIHHYGPWLPVLLLGTVVPELMVAFASALTLRAVRGLPTRGFR